MDKKILYLSHNCLIIDESEVNRRTLQRDLKTMVEKEVFIPEGATNRLFIDLGSRRKSALALPGCAKLWLKGVLKLRSIQGTFLL